MSIVSKFLDWLKPTEKSYGSRMMSSMSSPGYRHMPMMWTQDRNEMVRQFRHWVYVAVKTTATTIAMQTPIVSIVRPAQQNTQKWLSADIRRKALTQLKPHEDLEPCPEWHPLVSLLNNPNEPDTAFDLWYETTMYLELTGSAYWWLPPNGANKPAEIWVIPSNWVRPIPGLENFVQGYEIRPYFGGRALHRIPAEHMVQFQFKSPLSKYDGYSPLTAGDRWIDLADSIDQARWFQFQNGAVPNVMLRLAEDAEISSPDEMDRMKQEFKAKYSGVNNRGEPIILTNAVEEIVSNTASVLEMDYTGSAEQMRDMVLGLFGVPHIVAGISKEMTYGSVAATQAGYYWFTINPKLRYIDGVVTEKLAHRYDKKLRVWHQDKAPEDPSQKLQESTFAFQSGALTPNEIRQDQGKEPYRDRGDDPFIGGQPLKSREDEKKAAQAQQQAQQPPPAAPPPEQKALTRTVYRRDKNDLIIETLQEQIPEAPK